MLNENEIVMKLKINADSREIIHTAEKKYVNWVADTLKCGVEDLVLLDSLNPDDEEGDYLRSFFPAINPEVYQTMLIHSDTDTKQIPELCSSDFSVGVVYMGMYKGVPFIANQNASPFTVWVKEEDIRFINSEEV